MRTQSWNLIEGLCAGRPSEMASHIEMRRDESGMAFSMRDLEGPGNGHRR